MSKTETVLYMKAGCPYCAGLAGELKQKGVEYREVDVSRNAAALRKIKEEYGASQVPVLVEGKQVTIGYKGGG
ncbi:MAG: glutaredoxin family protein [Bacillota bacterium]